MIKINKGEKYGRFKVIIEVFSKPRRSFLCKCECGKEKIISMTHLRSGHTKSCGCLQKEKVIENNTTHSMTRSKTYISWKSMKDRCIRKKNKYYYRYGGRGIKVCDRWLNSFENFYKDMGECPEGLTIDRIDNDGNYESSNCSWSTKKEQAENRQSNRYLTFKGKTMIISQWTKKLNFKKDLISLRLMRGWSVEKTLTTNI